MDVGGTTTAAGIVTEDGEVVVERQIGTHAGGHGGAVGTLETIVDDLRAAADTSGIVAVGVGVPAIVDVGAGVVGDEAHHVPELAGVPLASRLQARCGVPVFVDNDVNALALGQWRFGAGRAARSLVVLAPGTGFGSGIVIDGRLVRGARGFAGELGHVPVKFDGPPCWCGGRGCLALYASGRGIVDSARTRAATTSGHSLLEKVQGDPARIDAPLVFRLAAEGEASAVAIVDEACQALGALLGIVVNGINPEVVVITGGVAGAFAAMERQVLAAAGDYAFRRALATTRIVIVPGDKRSSMRGAAALAFYELDRRGQDGPAAGARRPGRAAGRGT